MIRKVIMIGLKKQDIKALKVTAVESFRNNLIRLWAFAGADRGLYPEPGSGGVSADYGGCDFF